MKEQTGETYTSSPTSKVAAMAGIKEGKTTFLVGSLLGVWPGQQFGGVVTAPEHLHVVSIDTVAMKGCMDFLIRHCKAPDAIKRINIYNMEEDARAAFASTSEWDFSFYNMLTATYRKIHERALRGGSSQVHALLTSSVTTVGQALKRGLAGPPGQLDRSGKPKKGSGMDIAKWDAFGSQLSELRNVGQMDAAHCVWEAHLDKKVEGQSGEENEVDTLMLQGSSGKSFAANVGEPFRLRKVPGQKYQTHPTVDRVQIETRPSLTFLLQGRSFANLADREGDLTEVLMKLNYKVGQWNAPKKGAAAKQQPQQQKQQKQQQQQQQQQQSPVEEE